MDLNLQNLKTARENAGYSTIDATHSVCTKNAKTDRVKEWEEGEKKPTWKQLIKLADTYDTNVFLFTIKSTLPANRAMHDFRKGEGPVPGKVTKFIKLLLDRQEFIASILERDGQKNKLRGSGRNIQNPEELAQFIAKQIGYKIADVVDVAKQSDKLKYFRALLEQHDVFVMKTLSHSDIERNDMQGVYLSNPYAPLIGLNKNSNETTGTSQMFTLAHEVAHLFKDEEGVSNVASIDFRKQEEGIDPVEVFCNKVAANLLIPKAVIHEMEYSVEAINYLAGQCGVSPRAAFYRLKDSEKIDPQQVDSIEQEIKRQEKIDLEALQAKKQKAKEEEKNGGQYNKNMQDVNGTLFTNFVSALYASDQITAVEACNALKMSINKID